MRYYISGAMSSRTREEYTAHFGRAESLLRGTGCKVMNPARWGWLMRHLPYRFALALDMVIICFCDRVYMLDGWMTSDGAVAEHQFARSTGMIIEYEK